jgi:hypothetical protein
MLIYGYFVKIYAFILYSNLLVIYAYITTIYAYIPLMHQLKKTVKRSMTCSCLDLDLNYLSMAIIKLYNEQLHIHCLKITTVWYTIFHFMCIVHLIIIVSIPEIWFIKDKYMVYGIATIMSASWKCGERVNVGLLDASVILSCIERIWKIPWIQHKINQGNKVKKNTLRGHPEVINKWGHIPRSELWTVKH